MKHAVDVDYYVKPATKRLFLHYRINHQEHIFKAIVYNQDKFVSSETGRQYTFKRTYNCLLRMVVYVVTCTTRNIQYEGADHPRNEEEATEVEM